MAGSLQSQDMGQYRYRILVINRKLQITLNLLLPDPLRQHTEGAKGYLTTLFWQQGIQFSLCNFQYQTQLYVHMLSRNMTYFISLINTEDFI
jgi:hypothetical protein